LVEQLPENHGATRFANRSATTREGHAGVIGSLSGRTGKAAKVAGGIDGRGIAILRPLGSLARAVAEDALAAGRDTLGRAVAASGERHEDDRHQRGAKHCDHVSAPTFPDFESID
jgi:hypothetical protein